MGHLENITPVSAQLECSVILGTVNRPQMLQECVEAIRQGIGEGIPYEIVVAYGDEKEESLPWMRSQLDVRPVCGGMEGAIPAFNIAYRASCGKYVCQINDDVQVDPGSIRTAIQHLETNLSVAGVVFRYDRKDGRGYTNQKLGKHLHPNQVVVRRDVCEAIVEHLGGFWGDEEHRTDPTYGGDSAFGVLCIHLGFKLVLLDGVTCMDDAPRTKGDHLRRRVVESRKTHHKRWREMFKPLMAEQSLGPGPDDWPHIYIPKQGARPRRSPVLAGPPERVLHLSGMKLRRGVSNQIGLEDALKKLGPYRLLPWRLMHDTLGPEVLEESIIKAIHEHQPTLIFCQIQRKGWPSVGFLHKMKEEAPPGCVLLNWTGDVRTRADQPVQRWQVKLCHGVDIFLASNCTYPLKLKQEEHVPCATGYVICGTQPQENPWVQEPEMDTAEREDLRGKVTFVGHQHNWSQDRGEVFTALSNETPDLFRFYGQGWELPGSKGITSREYRAHIHAASDIILGASAFDDLRRYTSGRMTDALHTGAVYAMQAFPDWEGLGARDGEHVLVWRDKQDLRALLDDWIRPERAPDRARMRQAAHEIAVQEFTWESVMENFLAIIRDFRGRKG